MWRRPQVGGTVREVRAGVSRAALRFGPLPVATVPEEAREGPSRSVVAALTTLAACCRPGRTALTVAASTLASLALVALLVGKWDELSAGITGAPALVVAAAVALQVVALVSRSEAWYVCVRASGGSVGRRRLYRASSMGV